MVAATQQWDCTRHIHYLVLCWWDARLVYQWRGAGRDRDCGLPVRWTDNCLWERCWKSSPAGLYSLFFFSCRFFVIIVWPSDFVAFVHVRLRASLFYSWMRTRCSWWTSGHHQVTKKSTSLLAIPGKSNDFRPLLFLAHPLFFCFCCLQSNYFGSCWRQLGVFGGAKWKAHPIRVNVFVFVCAFVCVQSTNFILSVNCSWFTHSKHYLLNFTCYRHQTLEHEISCVNIHPVGDDPRAAVAAVGMWTDITVRLYSLPALTLVTKEPLAGGTYPRLLLLFCYWLFFSLLLNRNYPSFCADCDTRGYSLPVVCPWWWSLVLLHIQHSK